MDHTDYLDLADLEAAAADYPTEAVLVKGTEIIARGHDRTIELNDPIAIAELDCIRAAGRRNDQAELRLYSTQMPNMLVAGVIVQFGIGALVVRDDPQISPAIDFLKSRNIPVSFLNDPASEASE